jgi:hypothetical protein
MKRNVKLVRVVAGCCLTLYACVYHDLPVCDPNVTLQLIRQEAADCVLRDGVIEVGINNEGDYRFSLNGIDFQPSPVFTGLGAGDYTVTAISEGRCEYSLNARVDNKNGFEANAAIVPSGCKTSNGALTIEAVGGVPPFQYQLNGGPFQASNIFSDLASGSYQVLTRDSTGCDFSQTILMASGVGFDEVFNILQTNCAVSGCHNGSQFPMLTTFQVIHDNVARIRTQVINRNMPPPPNNPLTQQQIDAIVCWIDDGAPPDQ